MFKNITSTLVKETGKRVASFVAVNAIAGFVQTVAATWTSNYLARRKGDSDSE